MVQGLVTHVEFYRSLQEARQRPDLGEVVTSVVAEVPWSARAASALQGLVIGAVAACVVLLIFLVPEGVVLAPVLGVGVGTVAAVGLGILNRRRNFQLLDHRRVLAVAALVVGVVATVPPPAASHFGARLILLTAAGTFGYLSYSIWQQVRAAAREAEAWNEGYRRLAEDPQQASSVQLDIREDIQPGGTRGVAGTAAYADAAGVVRTVPLSTLTRFQFAMDGFDQVSDDSDSLVWHSVDHSVVLTRITLT